MTDDRGGAHRAPVLRSSLLRRMESRVASAEFYLYFVEMPRAEAQSASPLATILNSCKQNQFAQEVPGSLNFATQLSGRALPFETVFAIDL